MDSVNQSNPQSDYTKLFRSNVEKEIKGTSFPVEIGERVSLRYTKLKNYTVINKFNITGHYREYTEESWDRVLKDIYKKDYCLNAYYKELPIELLFIIYYELDNQFVVFKNPLKHYCGWEQ